MKPTLAWIGPKVAGPSATKQNIICKSATFFVTGIPPIYSYCREASSQEEFCKVPRTSYANIGKAGDPELISRMYEACLKSDHPSVHFCKKLPQKGFARKTHRQLKRLLVRLKKREKRRKSRRKNRKGKKGKKSGKGRKGGRQSGKRKKRRGKKWNREATASHVLETFKI